MAEKVALTFAEISLRLRGLELPPVDEVVGIASGGIVIAAMVAHQLGAPLSLLNINFRDEMNRPRQEQPRLLGAPPAAAAPKHILLVDDVAVSGATLRLARAMLSGHQLVTLVLKGEADYVLFPEIEQCVIWPWNVT